MKPSGYLLVDPRSAMRYLMGHLRGAVSVPLKKLQDEQGRLRPPEELAATFAAAGMGDDVIPVLYDGSDGRNAAMHAWILEYLGRDDIHIMDLLYDHWKEQGREVLYRPVATEARSFTQTSAPPSVPRWTTPPNPARPSSWTPAPPRNTVAKWKLTSALGTFRVRSTWPGVSWPAKAAVCLSKRKAATGPYVRRHQPG